MKYLKVFTDFAVKMKLLSDAERGRLFTAMLEYAESGAEPELRGNERFIWESAKSDIDRQAESYQALCERNKENRNSTSRDHSSPLVTSRDHSSEDKDKDKDKDKDNSKREITKENSAESSFIPPTVEEVEAYCRERGNSIDAGMFVDFYTSKGWKVGKDMMRDWKASVRTWERGHDDGNRRNQSRGVDREQTQTSDEKWGITYSA